MAQLTRLKLRKGPKIKMFEIAQTGQLFQLQLRWILPLHLLVLSSWFTAALSLGMAVSARLLIH